MFCPSCGAAIPQNLSFCKFCGARVSREADSESSQLRPGMMVSAMVVTFVFGLVANTFMMFIMRGVGLNEGVTMGFATFGFSMMLILEVIFGWLLFRGMRKSGDAAGSRRFGALDHRATNELSMPQVAALPEPAASVTEHTTRTFAPRVNNQQSQRQS
jgi:hypothetical protein